MCYKERIARSGSFVFDVCNCGQATLSLGPVSVRLDRDAVEELLTFFELVERRLVVRDEHGEHWREIVKAPDLEA